MTLKIARFLSLALAVGLALAACSPSDNKSYSESELATALVQVAAEWTETAEGLPSVTAEPAESSTATVNAAPSPSAVALTAAHGDGVYVVGVEIAPGVWQSTGRGQAFCYWARRKYDGIILGSYYGLPGGKIQIREDDYEVELDGCGEWVFMGE